MNYTYDSGADALYIQVRATPVARTIQIDPGTLVDLDAETLAVGVEILRPARPWPLDDLAVAMRLTVDETHWLAELSKTAGLFARNAVLCTA